MSKKSKAKQEQEQELFLKLFRNYVEAKQRSIVDAEVKHFVNDDIQANILSSSDPTPLTSLLALAKTPPPAQMQTPFFPDPKSPSPSSLGLTQCGLQDLLRKHCLHIQEMIKERTPFNIEVQLHRGLQVERGYLSLLGNTIVKIHPMGADKPQYLFIKDRDKMNASIFLGEDIGSGIMLIRDDNAGDSYLRLQEFHLLSLRDNPTPYGEVALITSFIWSVGKVRTCIVHGSALYPIKMLLMSECFQARWQQVKSTAIGSPNKEIGGEPNEQKQVKI